MKKDGKYGVYVEPKRDLTDAEADIVGKTLDLVTSMLRLHLKDDVLTTTPNKNNNSKPKANY